ncbi:MAG: UMP kinase [Candidatus Epulonipiscioides saccharophilum]|nr:MAG: UMP kinase [Epulopiscium sp. AS2M-Bin001]
MQYKNVLVKLSGEALAGNKSTGFDNEIIHSVMQQLTDMVKSGFWVSVVIGGGNFWRGRSSGSMDRTKADQIGMLATVMNALYVSDFTKEYEIESVIMTPFLVGTVSELFNKDKAREYLKAGKIVFFAGGTGHPYFTTDSGAVLKGCEIGADILLFAKNIDGVYDSDPRTNPNAKKYDVISCQDIIQKNLNPVDLYSVVLCKDNKLPIIVFDLNEENGIIRVANGENIGTKITV